MKTLTGHLTQTNKAHIKAILKAGLTEGRINCINYHLTINDSLYTVIISKKDRGLIPCPGSTLRISNYKSTFVL